MNDNVKNQSNWKAEEISVLKQKFWLFRKICYGIFVTSTLIVVLSMIEATGRKLIFSPNYLWVGLVLPWVGWYISHCIKLVKPWERLVVLRWGANFHRKSMRFPGVRWYWHGIDRGKFIQVWEQISDPEAREVITADNITVKVNPVIYFTIDNPLAFVAGAENPIKMMTELAQTLVLASCGQEGKTFEEIRGKVQEIGDDIKKSLNKESEKTEDENNADDQIEKKKIDEEIKPLKEEINKIKGEETTLSDNERFSFGKIKKKIGFKMSRNKIKRKLRLSESKRLLEECRRRWGIKVSRVQIQGLLPPEEVIRAMESVYKAKKMAQTEVENAKGQAAARKKIADVKKYEMKREAEGASALIAKQGQALSGSGGDRYFGIEVSKTIKSGDKVIVANLGDNKEGGIIGAMVGALVGGLKGKGDKKE